MRLARPSGEHYQPLVHGETLADFHAKGVIVVNTVGPYRWQWRIKEEGELNWRKVKSVEGNSGMLSQVGKEAVATFGQRRNEMLSRQESQTRKFLL